jgi:hypothetical protein
MSILSILNTIAAGATSCGVGVAAWQLWTAHRQAVTAFEDSLAREYRHLASQLPTKSFLDDGALSEEEYRKAFDEFYSYFDLSNEQTFLRHIGRVSGRTWTFWRDGMRANFKRKAFSQAWTDISKRSPDDFNELRYLVNTHFEQDPRDWKAASISSGPSHARTAHN